MPETMYDVLAGSEDGMDNVIRTGDGGVDVAPSNVLLASIEQALQGKPRREFRLADAVAVADGSYAYAVIDCPPALGFLTVNSLVAADEVLVPVDSSLLSLHGLTRLLDTVGLVERNAGVTLPVRPLSTMYDERTRICRHVRQRLEENFGEELLTTRIHASVAARESAARGVPIGKAFPRSKLHEEHLSLARELLARAPSGLDGARSRALLGATACGDTVTFRLAAPSQAKVAVAGEFNDWDSARGLMTFEEATGTWALRLRLEPGFYQYRFVLDGEWIEDPANPVRAHSREGFRNSVVRVGEAGT